VITKPVKPFALVVGNPAKQIGWVSENGHKLKFDESGVAFCHESNQKYQMKDGEVKRVIY
jgi:UDP-2-acetamido-3-amino-2,3-dideoxy-glucuronate N-acetyltransferase